MRTKILDVSDGHFTPDPLAVANGGHMVTRPWMGTRLEGADEKLDNSCT